MLIDKIFHYINKKSPIIIQTPWIGTIGNCAETIYFGLLRARRENKKVLFLFPHDLFWIFHFSRKGINRELLKVESEYRYLSYNSLLSFVGGWMLSIVYYSFKVVVLFLQIVFRKKLHGSYIIPNIGQSALWCPENMCYFLPEKVQLYKWKNQLGKHLPVDIPVGSYRKAERIRIEIGIPKDDWFVCLHVRESGFHNDSASSCRNATIHNYISAIREITKAGGWVVRMGDHTMTPLPKLERVIDYPHTPFKSDLMDIYLISECKFYIGSQSGIWDVALLFQKAILMPNMWHWTFLYPPRKGNLGIIKHVYSRSRKRFLSVRELFEEPWEAQALEPLGEDYEMYENTPEEIKDLVLEYLSSLDSIKIEYSTFQKEANKQRILQTYKLFKQKMFPDDDIYNKYRIASRVEAFSGTLGKNYLDQNWEKSSREK